jgi:hypothetical protein
MHALRIALLVVIGVLSGTAAARAQAAAHVLFQIDPNLAPALSEHVGQVLSNVGEVVPADIGAQAGDIAVAAQTAFSADGRLVLRLTYYDAVSAAALFGQDLQLANGELAARYDRDIIASAQRALAMVAPNGVGAAPAPAVPAPSADDAAPPAGSAPTDGTDGGDETLERPVAAALALGVGVGMHESSMPGVIASEHVPLSAFPAFDLALAVDGVSQAGAVTPGVRFAYRSSIGYTLSEAPPNGVAESSPARTHELLADVAININFGHSRRDVSLPILLGYAWSSLGVDAELTYVHRHTLSGPHVALGLRIPVADGAVVLAFGPDARFILRVSDGLRRAGVGGSGFSVGAEAQVFVRLSERFALRALFRETHASVSSANAGSFSDVQRFITLGVAATY